MLFIHVNFCSPISYPNGETENLYEHKCDLTFKQFSPNQGPNYKLTYVSRKYSSL